MMEVALLCDQRQESRMLPSWLIFILDSHERVRTKNYYLAKKRRTPRFAVAKHPRSLSHLAIRGHAAADAGGSRYSVLPAFSRALPRRRVVGGCVPR